MPAAQLDLIIEQGATLDLLFTWRNAAGVLVDLTGYSAAMKLRRTADSSDVLASWVSGTEITLGAIAGTIRLLVTAVETAALDFIRCVFDLEVMSGATVIRLLEGFITLSKEVTR